MKIEEAYDYLKYKDVKVGWYENVTEYVVSRVVQTSFGWMIEVDYVDNMFFPENEKNGVSKQFKKSIHVDIKDYNNWQLLIKAADRNNKLSDLGVNEDN